MKDMTTFHKKTYSVERKVERWKREDERKKEDERRKKEERKQLRQ